MGLVEDRALSEQVSDLLIEWITTSRLKSGERLRESELAQELGVSRTPVREALKRLAESGFVTIRPRRGIFVSDIDSERLAEILDLRHLLEMHAAQKGVDRVSQEQLQEMDSIIEECESLLASRDRLEYVRYLQMDCEFHRLIVKIGGNSLLSEFHDRLATFLQIAKVRLADSGPPKMGKGHNEHKDIAEAYKAQDIDLLLQALGSHLNRSKGELLALARSSMPE